MSDKYMNECTITVCDLCFYRREQNIRKKRGMDERDNLDGERVSGRTSLGMGVELGFTGQAEGRQGKSGTKGYKRVSSRRKWWKE